MAASKPSMQSEAAAVAAEKMKKSAAVGRGVEATEEQARAIIATAKKAVVEEAKTKTRADGGAGSAAGKSPSLKRSLECFLQGRNKNRATSSSAATRRRHLDTSTASSSSSSSSSN